MNDSVTPGALFGEENQSLSVPPNGYIRYLPNWLDCQQADQLFKSLGNRLDWQQRPIKMFGREIMQPRLTCFYGDNGVRYSYSGKTMLAATWSDELKQLKDRLNETLDVRFNSVLCNRYRDGRDSMGWHADNEPELGPNPVIASVSLGEQRRFRLKPRPQKKRHGERIRPLSLALGHGSLLVMSGDLQHHWLHELPKVSGKDATRVGPRINLTFRQIG